MTLFVRNIADYNKRIVLQKPRVARTAQGGYTTTWSTVDTVWARILPVSAKESRETDKETMTISHTVSIRYRRDIRPTWRLNFKLRYFALVGITNPEECDEWLDINVLEVKI